ncbi:hypothetical protein GOP47_0030333 [Adiantum capillus-veneris]|nr:hypothetical protein GOP47_0030333 [Adiantum capillus-veneris]
MGPAILLCPSSSAAHLWRQALPSLKPKQKEGSLSMSPRCFAVAGDLAGRPPFFLYSASPVEKCRKFFTWRRVSAAAAAAASEISVEEASVEEAVAVVDAEPSVADVEQSVAADAEESVAEEPATSSDVSASTSNEDTALDSSSSDVSSIPAEKTQARRSSSRSSSKKNITISPAELVPGAQFPGKVVAIQTFGAFVDFGAFTNGLAHISRLSKSYVKKVEDVVQVGQEVKVQILEVDFEANRISLMLVGEAEDEAQEEEGDKAKGGVGAERASQQQARAPRRDASRRAPSQRNVATTKLQKGEIIVGTVKNLIKSGVFIALPDGTDGYLPVQEVIFKVPNAGLDAQFQVGEEVTVRVLRVERGRVNLTMKREVNFDKLNEDLNEGVMSMGTNPFELAFRRNEVIASYLAERDKQKAQVESVDEGQKVLGESVEEEQQKVQEGESAEEEEQKVQSEAVVLEVKEEAVVGTD